MNASAVTIERVHDLDAAWADLWRLFQALVAHHEPITGERLQPDAARAWRRELRNAGGLIVIARLEDGAVVGFATAEQRHNPVLGVALGMLDAVYVEERHRRQGVARLLLGEVEAWCRERGLARLDLTVRAANGDGVAVWRALGFRDEALRLRREIE